MQQLHLLDLPSCGSISQMNHRKGLWFFPHLLQFYHYSSQHFLSECNAKDKSFPSSQHYFSILVKLSNLHVCPQPLTESFLISSQSVASPFSQFH